MDCLPEDETWAVTACADAALGGLRRPQRLVALATVLAQRPSASLPEACGGARALLTATYRFFDNAAIAPEDLLQCPCDATLRRLAPVPLVLTGQDTPELDWTTHATTSGLGPLPHPAPRGLHSHTPLAFTPERVPLGLLAHQVWARDPDTVGQKATRKRRPMAEKESHKGLSSLHAVLAARAQGPQTRFLSIGIGKRTFLTCLSSSGRPASTSWCARPARPTVWPGHAVSTAASHARTLARGARLGRPGARVAAASRHRPQPRGCCGPPRRCRTWPPRPSAWTGTRVAGGLQSGIKSSKVAAGWKPASWAVRRASSAALLCTA